MWDLFILLGKEINLEMEGEEIELDIILIEVILFFLIYLVCNCVDYGIELFNIRINKGKFFIGRFFLRVFY